MEIQESWKFCPYCGTDNRPPEYRPVIRGCVHCFVQGQQYCINCGGTYGDRYVEVPEIQRKAGIVSIAIGAALWLFAGFVSLVHTRGRGPLIDWINSWYNATHFEYSIYVGKHPRINGPTYISNAFLVGLFLIVLGGCLMATKRSMYYTGDTWQDFE